MKESKLLQKADQFVNENIKNIKEDPHRLHFHLMPPVGLLNDPNGLIQHKGVYHVFYQWNPFETAHGAKFWGHFTSKDLVTWKAQPPALAPEEWYEKNGCYSGSAVEKDGNVVLFYTGNVKNKVNERESYQCMAVSEDGINFNKKGPVILLPEGYTAHFRDPKVWNHVGVWYMVVGAQNLNHEGVVSLFSSQDLKSWVHEGPFAGSNMNRLGDFGYMWECPDFFQLESQDILLVSPQGLEPEGHHYQNVFQSGYFIGKWKVGTTEFNHGDFHELDRGFDFYAPQTFEDNQGRRIMFAWMGITDENEAHQPTIKRGWIHALTIPRELILKDNRLYQKPVEELRKLRNSEVIQHSVSLDDELKEWGELKSEVSELKVIVDKIETDSLQLMIRNTIKISYQPIQQLFTLERKSFKDGTIESRSCRLASLKELHIFLDTSSIELFLNGGQEVFTARFFADQDNKALSFRSKSGETKLSVQQWLLGSSGLS